MERLKPLKQGQWRKGIHKKKGIDYEETFSSVAMLKSITILLSIATHYDYEIWQMDDKTAFQNGNLGEEIYMIQPEGFIAKNQQHMVCEEGEIDVDGLILLNQS